MLSMLQDKLMVRSEGVKGRTADEVMEGTGSQIRLSGNKFLESNMETSLGGYSDIVQKR